MLLTQITRFWLGAMFIVGFGFGLFAENEPFGSDPLAHPLIVFFGIAAAALLALRVVLREPLPKYIPERILLVGVLLGAVGFLVGDWMGPLLNGNA
jgi:drug/metabolite transporter (DMT)-like permease